MITYLRFGHLSCTSLFRIVLRLSENVLMKVIRNFTSTNKGVKNVQLV